MELNDDDLSDADRERLEVGTMARMMLDRTLDMWRMALGDEIVCAVMTVVIDREGVGPVSVCVSHPADDPELIVKTAGQTAEMLGRAL